MEHDCPKQGNQRHHRSRRRRTGNQRHHRPNHCHRHREPRIGQLWHGNNPGREFFPQNRQGNNPGYRKLRHPLYRRRQHFRRLPLQHTYYQPKGPYRNFWRDAKPSLAVFDPKRKCRPSSDHRGCPHQRQPNHRSHPKPGIGKHQRRLDPRHSLLLRRGSRKNGAGNNRR